MNTTPWNAASYQAQHSYVWQLAENLIGLLQPLPNEQIIDLGCGTGQLSATIADSGATVLGLDQDPAMVELAQTNYPVHPRLRFARADATRFDLTDVQSADFQFDVPVDAVFSNAVLHWVPQAEAAANCVARVLKPGGRFVAEFGGKGNIAQIAEALGRISGRADWHPWYFPSIRDYATVLEANGLEVTFAQLFERPTSLKETGLSGWLEMFARRFFTDLSDADWAALVAEVEADAIKAATAKAHNQSDTSAQLLHQPLYQDGQWVADYRRIRVMAIKKL
jgi:SAM-dependent methyltransferase